MPAAAMASLTMRVARRITLGSDCSGVGTEALALERLNVPYRQAFMSDINQDVRTVLKRRLDTSEALKDCRLFPEMMPDRASSVDVYVCGFPCQPFRAAAAFSLIIHSPSSYNKLGPVIFHCRFAQVLRLHVGKVIKTSATAPKRCCATCGVVSQGSSY